jgi:MFS-type transporter involved in bile tolerance (Atg22 family)
VLGLAQGLALGTARDGRRPLPLGLVSAAGLAASLALGGALVGWSTTPGALAAQGLVSGAVVGAAQWPVLAGALGSRAAVWPLLTSAAWALGWLTTEAIGVDVERQYAVFGASGALVATALTGVLAVPAVRRRSLG